MANRIELFMEREDELSFIRFLERNNMEVYPRRVPADYVTFKATEATFDQLPEEDVYLVASDIGPALVDKLKRGKDKGQWRIDEVRSPVIFWERCKKNDDGELVAGQLWAELEITQQTGRRDPAPEKFRMLFLEIDNWIKKTFRKSHPKGFWIGPKTAKSIKQSGLKLRENKHWGRAIEVHGI
jgi:hypothetical protein